MVGRFLGSAVLACGFLAAGLMSVQAQTTRSTMDGLKLSNDKPIQIESDKLEIREQESLAEFTGNVQVVQGTTTLRAGHMIVHYTKGGGSVASGAADIESIDVSEKVLLTSETQQATADTGSFNMKDQTFVLKGKQVVLSEGENVFTGCQLTVLMASGQAKLDNCGGRVQIQLDPKSQKKN